ncbi:hypothetical protein KRP22_012114 [Phytophthora ramorum]|nr:Pyridoxal phosphate homeostasis protein [Phytophthora ramorum]
MEGGTLARIPVLRSVPVPMTRPWATRGAITLLLVCGVVFGVIAIASMNNGSETTSAAVSAEGPANNANVGGVTIVSGSSSLVADNGATGSTSTDESTLGSSTADKSEDSSVDTSDDSPSEATAGLSGLNEESASGSNHSTDASSFEEVIINPLETWTDDSQLGSVEGSASDASESQSASGSEQDFLISGSASTDFLGHWIFDSVSGSQDSSMEDSALVSDWHSSSADDENSDSLSRSEDSSSEDGSTKNLLAVRAKVAEAVGKSAWKQQCTLVAVSKTKPIEDLQEAYEADQRHFGENYIQELVQKAPLLPADVKWHYIGHVQSNKAKPLVRDVPNLFVVETVDSIKIANALNKASGEFRSEKLNVMVQVNTSEEEQKSGSDADSSVELARHITVAEAIGKAEADLALSMGMSGDYELAISCGSTHVRVGSTIFGVRNYANKE